MPAPRRALWEPPLKGCSPGVHATLQSVIKAEISIFAAVHLVADTI